MDTDKEVIIAILGASVALAGLLLVFCGFLFTQAASFPRETTPDDVIDRYRRAGKSGLIPFLISLALAGTSLAWLLCPAPWLFSVCWIGFSCLLVLTAIYGTTVVTHHL
jgi:hypothetical protein